MEVDYDKGSGLLNLLDLKAKLSDKTAAIYFENPSYIGTIETQAEEICKLAKAAGALVIVGVDPVSYTHQMCIRDSHRPVALLTR